MNKHLTVLLLFSVLMFSLSDASWIAPLGVPATKASVSNSWCYSDMGYRVEHNITGSPAGNQTNYQMKITIVNGTGTSSENVHYTTHVNQSDFHDVRFTWYNTTSGWDEQIDYWCEEVNPGSNATFWVEIPEVSNVTDNTIYIYYGNSHTATTSNVNAAFIRVIDGNQPVVLALPMDEDSGNKTYDRSGNDNDGTLYPTPAEVNNCDRTTDWSGTSLSSETNDKVEGSASVKDTTANPTVGTDYDTSYNPSGSWNWSSKKHIVFWVKCDRASTAFTNARLVLVDTSNRERNWDISFDADEWTRTKKNLYTFAGEDEGFDLSAVDRVVVRFEAADTTDFYKLVDYIQIDDGPQWVDGRFGKALCFDGQDDLTEVAYDSSLDITDAVTVLQWVKPQSTQVKCPRFSSKDWSHWSLWVSSWSSRRLGVRVLIDGTRYDVTEPDGVITADEWQQVGWSFNGTTVTLIRNGEIVYSENHPGKLDASPNSFVIGVQKSAGGNPFNGLIDEVRIYNRALTEEEICDLYSYYGYATTSYAGRVLVRKRVDPEPSHGTWGREVRYVPVHDIAVVSVTPSSTEVVKGNSIDVLVEVRNEGTESETFNVTACYDSNTIDTQTNISLKPRANKILTLTWNTTTVFVGNYNIYAQASTVLGETDTDDNILTGGTVKVIIGCPMPRFTYSPANPFVNETVTFNATLSTPNGGILINYTWAFGDGFYGDGVIVYHNYSKAGTYNVTLTVTDDEMVDNTASVTITVFTHNVAIISVTPFTNEIYKGQTMNITVIVKNNGNITETFNVTIHANTTVIQTQAVSNLAPAAQTTLTFIWNTARASPGNYTIKAEASVILGETYAAQTITVRTHPSWYAPLVAWLINVPPLVWAGIGILVILGSVFRLRLIEIEIEGPLESTKELQDRISRVLQPLAEKDKRFIPLQQFVHRLLEEGPPPETIKFLQSTFPTIIKAIEEPKEETEKT